MNLETAVRTTEFDCEREEKVLAMMARCIDGMDVFSGNNQSQSSQSYEPKNTVPVSYEEALENMKRVLNEAKNPFANSSSSKNFSIGGDYACPDKVVPIRKGRFYNSSEKPKHPRLKLIASSVAAILTPVFYSVGSYQR